MNDCALRQGVLLYLSKGSFIKKFKEHYVLLMGASMSGLARLEVYEACKSYRCNKHVLVLVSNDIIKVIQEDSFARNGGRGFTVTAKTQQHFFVARDMNDSEKWVKAIQETLLKPTISLGSCIVQDNDIYMSSEEVRQDFPVQVDEETRMKLKVEGTMRVFVEHGTFTVISMGGKKIVSWAINNLRKFGFNSDSFHLEVGRKSAHGPGIFKFITSQGRRLARLVHQEKEYIRYQMMHARDAATPLHAAVSAPTQPPHVAAAHSSQDIFVSDIYDPIEAEYIQAPSGPRCSSLHSVKSLDEHVQAMNKEHLPNSKKSSGSLDSLKGPKSRPTKPAAAAAITSASTKRIHGLQTFSEPIRTDDNIYSDPEVMEDAWKTHGYGPSSYLEYRDDSSDYDVLQFLPPKRDEEQQPSHHQASIGAIYAEINWKKKKNRGGANFDDL